MPSGSSKYVFARWVILLSISTPVTVVSGEYLRKARAYVPVPMPRISAESACSAIAGAASATS